MKSYKIILFTPLRRRLLEVLEQRRPLLVLLDAGEDHLRAFNELLRVREPLVHRLVVPRHAAPRHGAAEGEARRRAGRAAEDAVQVRALLVRAAGLDRVALAAPAYDARMVSRSLRSLLSTARRMSSVREIAAPRPRLVLKIFAPLSPLPIGHCVSSFLAIGSADPQISAFILRAAASKLLAAVGSTCCTLTVSPCVALRCTDR